MPIRFPNFEGSIYPAQILDRGEQMYQDGNVGEIDTVGPNSFEATVESQNVAGEEYDVRVRVNSRQVVSHRCNCPYRFGPVCKHVVAVLYEIRDGGYVNRRRRVGRAAEAEEEEEEEEDEEGGEEDEESGEDSNEDDDEEEDEEEEEENDLDKSIEKRINERKLERSKSELLKKSDKSQITATELLSMRRSEDEADNVEKEFNCQICLGEMELPVSMACSAHSMCYDCCLGLFKHQKKDSKGFKSLSCPTCREGSGSMKIKKISDIKVNFELKRIKEAYELEKKFWNHEKKTFEEMASQKIDEPPKKDSKSKKEGVIDKELENMDKMELEKLATKILIKLEGKGVSIDGFLTKIKENTKENVSANPNKRKTYQGKEELEKEEEKKSVGKETESNKDKNARDERYAIRSLKRLKTIFK